MASSESSSRPHMTISTGARSRSGSFKGELNLFGGEGGSKQGYVHFSYSDTHKTVFTDTIKSSVKGGGTVMHSALDNYARDHTAATQFQTATSRPGFFQKMGYDYSASQKRINALKYTPTELATQEANRDESGGGFDMVKPITRKSSCVIM